MKRVFNPNYLWIVVLLIGAAACTVMFFPTPTVTASLTRIVLPTPTATPSYLVNPLSEALPARQYLAYVYGECSSNDKSICKLSAISIDGTVNQLLSENFPSEHIVYNRGRIALTSGDPPYSAYRVNYVLDLESGQYFQIPKPAGKFCETQDWSPDGTQLVVLCYQPGDSPYTDIALLSVPNGELTILLHDLNENDDSEGYDLPRWSPDGKWLSFYHYQGGPGPDWVGGLYVLDMSCVSEPSTCQAKIRRLPIGVPEVSRVSAWTPDGYLSRANGTCIEVYDVTTGQRIRTFQAEPEDDNIQSIAWSSDGEWLAITQWHSGTSLIPVHGGEPIKLDIYDFVSFWITILPDFETGVVLKVSPVGVNLNLRSEPSVNGAVLKKLQSGSTIEILDGPVMADDYTWWKVDAEGNQGWVVEEPSWYLPVDE